MKKRKMANSIITLIICFIWMHTSVLAKDEPLINESKDIRSQVESRISDSLKIAHNYVDDSLLTAKVKSALIDAKEIEGHQISVTTKGGIVHLSGFVSRQTQAQQAVSLAQKVVGVKAVNNQISLITEDQQKPTNYVSDMVITAEVKAKLLIDSMVSARHVHVATYNGVVMLSGYAVSKRQIQQVVSIVSTVVGVKEVYNNLVVEPA